MDDLIGHCNPIMIKLDVEGYEEQVLRGAQRALANKILQAIELETVSNQTRIMLAEYKFQASYDPFSRTLCWDPLKYSSSNALFVRDFSYVATRLATADQVRIFDQVI